MAKGDMSIDIYAEVVVTDETADRCLRILEMWLEDNPQCEIVGERQYSGDGKQTINLKRVRRREP